jgi:hypothetical protein
MMGCFLACRGKRKKVRLEVGGEIEIDLTEFKFALGV